MNVLRCDIKVFFPTDPLEKQPANQKIKFIKMIIKIIEDVEMNLEYFYYLLTNQPSKLK